MAVYSVAIELSDERTTTLALHKTPVEVVTVNVDLSSVTSGRTISTVNVRYTFGVGLSLSAPIISGLSLTTQISGGTIGTYHSIYLDLTLSDGDLWCVELPVSVGR